MNKRGFAGIGIIIAVVLAAAIAGGAYLFISKKASPQNALRYETELFTQDNRDNFRLVSYDSVGNRNVIFSSLREKDIGLSANSEDYHTLFEYSFPKTGDYLFFREGLPNTDGGFGAIFSYNIQTRKFSKLEYPNGYLSGVSPNGNMTLLVSDDSKSLYLIDLPNNKYKLIVSLGEKETFMHYIPECCGSGGAYEIKWIDDKTIEYGVFDDSRPTYDNTTGKFLGPHDLIEYRTINILSGVIAPQNQSPQSSIPSNWKTIQNDKYGFAISTPPDYVLSSEIGNLLDGLVFTIGNPNNIPDFYLTLYLPSAKPLYGSNNQIISEKNIEINGISGKQIIIRGIDHFTEKEYPCPFYEFKTDRYIYRFTGYESCFEGDTLMSVLNTFKLISPLPTTQVNFFPTQIGQCQMTTVKEIWTWNYHNYISYSNGGAQDFSDDYEIKGFNVGDPVNFCYVSHADPSTCKELGAEPGDLRPYVYRAKNLNTGAEIEGSPNLHVCSGA